MVSKKKKLTSTGTCGRWRRSARFFKALDEYFISTATDWACKGHPYRLILQRLSVCMCGGCLKRSGWQGSVTLPKSGSVCRRASSHRLAYILETCTRSPPMGCDKLPTSPTPLLCWRPVFAQIQPLTRLLITIFLIILSSLA